MVNLYIEYFQSKNIERKQEIISSIEKNISLNFIDKFYIFAKNFDWLLSKHKKIFCVKKTDRCTFGYVFNFSNLVSTKEDTNILINNDIVLTESFKDVQIDEKTFFCITRFKNEKNKHPEHTTGISQDTWVWKGKNLINKNVVNFYMGIPGCDNRLAYEASLIYDVKNPAYRYKTIHNHKSNIRTYDEKNKIPQPYKFIKPEYFPTLNNKEKNNLKNSAPRYDRSNKNMKISYVIISNNNNYKKTKLTIDSINYQYKNINYDYEIIVCGLLEQFLKNKVDVFLMDEFSASNGYVGKLRNLGSNKAKYENITFLDDDIVLNHNWLNNTIGYQNDWSVLGSKINNIDGSRFWDRCTYIPRHKLISYETKSSPKLYQTSGFMMIKKEVLEKVSWCENTKIHSTPPEDILFSQNLHKNRISIDFNRESLVWHNSDLYVQSGDIVIKQKAHPCADFLDNINIIKDIVEF